MSYQTETQKLGIEGNQKEAVADLTAFQLRQQTDAATAFNYKAVVAAHALRELKKNGR